MGIKANTLRAATAAAIRVNAIARIDQQTNEEANSFATKGARLHVAAHAAYFSTAW